MKKETTLRVLYVQAGLHPEERVIPNDLAQMQALVGGLIEPVYPPWEEPDPDICLVCDHEGKINGSAYNRYIKDFDIIAGSFFICGIGEEDFISLTDAQLQKYEKLFHNPQLFTKSPAGLLVAECNPDQYARVMQDREMAKRVQRERDKAKKEKGGEER